MAKKELITKEELDKVTSDWLDETELTQDPLDIFNDRDGGKEFDPEADARRFAEELPDKKPKGYSSGRSIW